MMSKSLKAFAAAVAGASALMLVAAPAQAAGNKCRATVAKESAQAHADDRQDCCRSVKAASRRARSSVRVRMRSPRPASASAKDKTEDRDQQGVHGRGRPVRARALPGRGRRDGSRDLHRHPHQHATTASPTVSRASRTRTRPSSCTRCSTSKFIPARVEGHREVPGGDRQGHGRLLPDQVEGARRSARQACSAARSPVRVLMRLRTRRSRRREAKKVAGITKACCGDDGVCGGGQCVGSPANVVVKGCTGAGAPAACCTGVGTGTCTNADCTGAGAPLPCCTGAGTGTCFVRLRTPPASRPAIASAAFRARPSVPSARPAVSAAPAAVAPTVSASGGITPGQMCRACQRLPSVRGLFRWCERGRGVHLQCPEWQPRDAARSVRQQRHGVALHGRSERRQVLLDRRRLPRRRDLQQDRHRVLPERRLPSGAGHRRSRSVSGSQRRLRLDRRHRHGADGREPPRSASIRRRRIAPSVRTRPAASFATGSLTSGTLPGKCAKVIDDCISNGGTVDGDRRDRGTPAVNLGGVSVNLGFPYEPRAAPRRRARMRRRQVGAAPEPVHLAGAGVATRATRSPSPRRRTSTTPSSSSNGTALRGRRSTRAARRRPRRSFPCVVQSASDVDGNAILTGVTCSVTVP